jgi:hypothetical protein
MAQANDSVTVTPGAGATIATHLANGKEYQVVMTANPDGHLMGSIPTYSAWSGVVAVAAANTVLWHLFNASGSGKILKVRKIFIQPSQAVNALAAQTFRIAKTSAVGTTGNTAITIQKHDSADAALPAQVTCARSYTAGGTEAFTFFEIPISVEETLPAVGLVPYFNLLPTDGEAVTDIILREGEGLAVKDVTGGAYSFSVLGTFGAI